jgi:hypothetical protein
MSPWYKEYLDYSMLYEPEVWDNWIAACFMSPRYGVLGLQHDL